MEHKGPALGGRPCHAMTSWAKYARMSLYRGRSERHGVQIGWRLVGALAWCSALACEQSPCQAMLTREGESVAGLGASKAEALTEACVVYCVKHDPLLDSKYRVWKAAGGRSSGDKRKDIEGMTALKRLMDACRERCRGESGEVKYQNCAK